MKKIILIISVVMLAAGILGSAVTALPTMLKGEKYMNDIIDGKSKKQEFSFDDTFTGLDVNILSADTTVSYNSGNEVRVSYITADKNKKAECNITDGVLNVKEKSGFSLFSLFTLGSAPTKIEISLPESYRDSSTLENADITVASGSLSGDLPYTKKSTKLKLYSGKISSSVGTENFDINVSSGTAEISSRNNEHKNVNVSVLSGKITLDGFISEKSDYSLTSGKINSANIGGGELFANVTSGSLTLGCSEKVTYIDAKVASGKADISVPKGTGAQVAYSTASGSVKIGLDGENNRLIGSGNISYGNAETKVNVNVASGSFILDTDTISE